MRTFSSSKLLAFSLIELLSSVAIISILAALIVAGLGKAKKSGAMATDIGNLRQIGLAIANYTQDNNAQYPTLTGKTGSQYSPPFWVDLILPYTGMEHNNKMDAKGAIETTGIFRCPFPGKYHHNWVSDYGANNFVIVDPADYPFSVRGSVPVAQVTRPSQTILVANAVAGGVWSSWPNGEYSWLFNGWDVSDGDQPRPYPIWGTHFNAVYADGAVRQTSYKDLLKDKAAFVGGNAPLNDIRYEPR